MIRIQNIYHMLAYAFQVLHEQGYRDMAAEDFGNAAELLTAILCRGVSMQIKRGLKRQYIERTGPLRSPRGKLEICASIKTQAIQKRQIVCTYDEFSIDTYPDRIIKTTMEVLLRADISRARKKELRRLLIYFEETMVLDTYRIDWDLRYDRNDQTYRMLMGICRFILKGLVQTTADGKERMMDHADDQTMARLYEKFILGYFQREHPSIKAYSPRVAWKVTDGYRDRLPIMQTDVVLFSQKTKKTLIIDAKYHAHDMQTRAPYMTQTIRSSDLYQIFAYVENWVPAPGGTVSGMLLYARTDDAIQPDDHYQIDGIQISVETLDLDCDFAVIAAQLDRIAAMVMG